MSTSHVAPFDPSASETHDHDPDRHLRPDAPSVLSRRAVLTGGLRLGASGALLRAGVLGSTAVTGVLSATPALAAGYPTVPGTPPERHDAEVLQDWLRTLYDALMDEPSTTPGRAARTYATASVAAYETLVVGSRQLRSLGGQLNGLTVATSRPSAAVDWSLAVSAAVHAATRQALRTAPSTLQPKLDAQLATHVEARRSAGTKRGVIDRSLGHGTAVGSLVGEWIVGDGAEGTYGRPYAPPVGESLWRSTPPNFGTAIDPYWGEVRTMGLRSADACTPKAPVAFSTAEGSPFFRQAEAVLVAADALTDAGRLTSTYWRDNPVSSGLPSGHWMLLTAQIAGEQGMKLTRAAEVLAITGIALHDAFVSCWHEKYRTNLLRPISYIQAYVPGRSTWTSFVNTPQFPEYTSGHSVASQAAATVLTRMLGTTAFTDRTHAVRNPQLGARSFGSFQAAADEAANSRLLGGIHYPMGIEVGMAQGAKVGRKVLQAVRTR